MILRRLKKVPLPDGIRRALSVDLYKPIILLQEDKDEGDSWQLPLFKAPGLLRFLHQVS
jgi:hypothetical protein